MMALVGPSGPWAISRSGKVAPGLQLVESLGNERHVQREHVFIPNGVQDDHVPVILLTTKGKSECIRTDTFDFVNTADEDLGSVTVVGRLRINHSLPPFFCSKVCGNSLSTQLPLCTITTGKKSDFISELVCVREHARATQLVASWFLALIRRGESDPVVRPDWELVTFRPGRALAGRRRRRSIGRVHPGTDCAAAVTHSSPAVCPTLRPIRRRQTHIPRICKGAAAVTLLRLEGVNPFNRCLPRRRRRSIGRVHPGTDCAAAVTLFFCGPATRWQKIRHKITCVFKFGSNPALPSHGRCSGGVEQLNHQQAPPPVFSPHPEVPF